MGCSKNLQHSLRCLHYNVRAFSPVGRSLGSQELCFSAGLGLWSRTEHLTPLDLPFLS